MKRSVPSTLASRLFSSLSAERLASFVLAAFSALCLLVATERQAHAYVDPGSGLLALQSLASVLAAAGYFLRRRIAALFGRSKAPAAGVVISKPVAPVIQKDNSRSAA